MTNKTKLYSSAMSGAPVLNGMAGSMISLLDALLVSGFGTTSVVSLVVAGGVATATFSAGHPFLANSVANFSAATPIDLNGDKRVISTTSSSVKFDATGIADQTAGGAIVAKVAPLGFTKSFAGTNLAAYKMADAQGTGFSLRVDDTGTTTARVRGFEAMTDVDTGAGLFPSLAQFAAPGEYWTKSSAPDASARVWYVVGDSRGFYFFVNNAGVNSACMSYFFGDILPLKSNDPYACVLRGNTSAQPNSQSMITDDLGYADSGSQCDGMYVARSSNTLGGSVKAYSCPTLSIGLPLQHVTGGQGWEYPSPVDNGLILSPVVLYQAANGFRGYFPGLRTSPQYVGASFNTGDYVDGTGIMAGKKVLVIKLGSANPGNGQAVLFMDPISDWRI